MSKRMVNTKCVELVYVILNRYKITILINYYETNVYKLDLNPNNIILFKNTKMEENFVSFYLHFNLHFIIACFQINFM